MTCCHVIIYGVSTAYFGKLWAGRVPHFRNAEPGTPDLVNVRIFGFELTY